MYITTVISQLLSKPIFITQHRGLEFEVFATSQEDCRKKWLTTEERCSSALKELNEAQANKEKLELQVRHVTELLKNEILIRQRLQKEEKDLVNI